MVWLITATTFIFVASLVWLIARALLRPRAQFAPAARIEGIEWLIPGAADRRPHIFIESLAGLLPRRFLAGEEVDKDLRRAGYYGALAKTRYLAIRNGLTVLAVLVTAAIVAAIGPGMEHRRAVISAIGVGLGAAIVCFSLPRIILGVNARRRVGLVRDALPDALDTTNMCLRGGVSLHEALEYVGRELIVVHPDLGLELLIVGRQTEINSFPFAIEQFASRIDAPEVISLASLVAQSQRLGSGIVDALRDFADRLRLKRRQMAEARAGRTELYLLFPVIFCLVPSILLILWGPPILSLLDFVQNPASPLRVGR